MTNWTSTNAYTAGIARELKNDKGYTFRVNLYGGGYEVRILKPDGTLENVYDGLTSWNLAGILNSWQVKATQ